MFLPNELLSDITNFLPNDDVENLVFLSRAFVAVTAKRLPIINEKYKSPYERHIDVDKLLEDYAWRMFDLTRQKKNSNLKKFKDMKKEEAAFNINRKHLNLVHDDPIYRNVQQTEERWSQHIHTMFTKNTSDAQPFFEGGETASEIYKISRLQGYTFGGKTEIALKIPREIAELKSCDKCAHFNVCLANNSQYENLIWGKDFAIKGIVPAGEEPRAYLVSKVVSYSGNYTLVSTLSGEVTVNISRAGVLIHRAIFNVATAFQHYLVKPKPRLKRVVTMDHGKVKLTSTGTCHFEFTLKQNVELYVMSPKQTFVVTPNTDGRDRWTAAIVDEDRGWIGGAAPSSEMDRMYLMNSTVKRVVWKNYATTYPLVLSGVTATAPYKMTSKVRKVSTASSSVIGGYVTTYPLAPTGVTATATSSEMNLQGYNSRPRATYADVARDPNYRALTMYRPPIQTNPAGGIPFHQRMRTERDGNFHQRARSVTRAPENLRPTVHRPAAESTSSHSSQRQGAYTSHEILQQLHSRSQY
ncbi:CBR-LIN-24 protein [Ditylenchus destructor]|nr:CBR-LIN-24 protein [Ditylenchus destructor]